MSKRSPGRPPSGSGDVRSALLGAARKAFREKSYDEVTLRALSEAAGVDHALVRHYFGSKGELFVEAMGIPDAASDTVECLRHYPSGDWGALIAEVLLTPDVEATRTAVQVIRAATSEPRAAELIREFHQRQIQLGLMELGVSQAAVRATLIGSLVVGLTFSSEILNLPEFENAPIEVRRALLTSILNAIITTRLGPEGPD